MTIDVLGVRTPRRSRDDRDERFVPNRNATIDVSVVPAEEIESYVKRAVGDGYEECYLERKGTGAHLTAVRTQRRRKPRSRKLRQSREGEEASNETGATRTTASPVATIVDADPRGTDRAAAEPNSEWGYAVFATERTPQ
jgi:hypothetical protein